MADSSLSISDQSGVHVVGFRDNSILDVLTIQKIGRELYELVEKDGKLKIVLDFENVRFLSSQALGVLLTLKRKADKAGAAVVLARLRPELARVFKITNLDKMFAFFDSQDAALAHFGVQPAREEKK
ncbi:putative anti-sigma factor antagonist [Phycisphaerae bacterium RAS1]|nr:putative anti-sigma factor antagonist [Phycisphaerae bacterium RAS1]